MNMKQSCKALICAIEGELDGRHCTEEQAAAILDHALPSLTEALARVQSQLAEAVGLLRYSQEIARLFDDEHTAEVGRLLARHAEEEQQEARTALATQPAAGEPVATWVALTAAGQLRKGDKIRFRFGEETLTETVALVLDAGTEREEIVYNRKRNFYFITSKALAGTSSAKEVEVLRTVAAPPAAAHGDDFQARVQPWMLECFGEMIAGDREERNHRFLEEALELVQSTGCTVSEAHQLVDYVFGRPVGEPAQEVGGVMVTLAALCLANSLDMHDAAEVELARIWTKVEAIRAKQAAKPKHSPLPVAAAHGDEAVQYRLLRVGEIIQATDELLRDDCTSWQPMSDGPQLGIGWGWHSGLMPVRRVDAAMRAQGDGGSGDA